ncbi:MAG TPA: hypothetical protein VL992_05710, partial [Tepidisphaeraceae bacterium]|nr:hypothetical protein [Tepidisphaeraceae bacterium]
VYDLDGTLKTDHRVAVNAAVEAATDLGMIDFPADLSAVHFAKLELRDASGQMRSQNFYWRALPPHAEDFSALDTLPLAKLIVHVDRHDSGGQCILDVNVANPTTTVALMAHFQLRRRSSGERVLPVYYSDNYISLLPGESARFQVNAALADLHGEAPVLMLDGWNVTADAGDGVAINTDALPSSWPMGGFGPAK